MNNNSPDYIAATVMVALASLVGARVQVQPKQNDTSWREVPTLWGAVVGDPSKMKSPSLSVALSLLSKVQKEFDETYTEAFNEYEVHQELDELKKKRLLKEKSAAFFKRKISDEEMVNALSELKKSALTAPDKRDVIINDTTYEALSIRLKSNPFGVLMVKDELSGWMSDMFLEKNATANAFFLAAFSASTMKFSQERVGRENIELPRIVMSLMGGIQPAMLIPFLQKRKSGEKNDGMIERIQLKVFPDSLEFKLIDQPPCELARKEALSVFQKLAELQASIEGGAIIYKFSMDAQPLFNERIKQTAHKIALGVKDKDNGLVSILGKQDTLLAKLALLLHIVDKPDDVEISLQALQQACKWQEYLWGHSQRIHALVDSPNAEAYSLLGKLDKLKNPLTASDFKSKGWTKLVTSTERRKAIDTLVKHGYLFKEPSKKGEVGRPFDRYHKHPSLLSNS